MFGPVLRLVGFALFFEFDLLLHYLMLAVSCLGRELADSDVNMAECVRSALL